MLDVNLKPTQRMALLGAIDPQSSSAAVETGWIDGSKFANYLAIVQAGALGASATVDAKIQQATDNAGTGVKDVAGKAIVQLTKVGSNDDGQCLINLRRDDLDFANGFQFFRLLVTPGTAASLVAGIVLGMDSGYDPPTQATSVEQTIN